MRDDLRQLLSMQHGHFVYESGHHGDLWLDLDQLFIRHDRIAPLASELAESIVHYRPEIICGPMVGGAFLAQLVAASLGVAFVHAEQLRDGRTVGYHLPHGACALVRGRRVAVVDDVINAGSATTGALDAVGCCGGHPVAFGALLVLGTSADRIAAEGSLPLLALDRMPSNLWSPAECPLCAARTPLADPSVSPV